MIEGRFEEKRSVIKGLNLKVRIGVFFDGTNNNKYNSVERDRSLFENNLIDEIRLRGRSYYAEQSNIAKLSELYMVGDIGGYIVRSVYVEGVATSPRGCSSLPGGFDSFFGSATGMGANGINGCIERCCRDIATILRGVVDSNMRGESVSSGKTAGSGGAAGHNGDVGRIGSAGSSLANSRDSAEIEVLVLDIFGFSRGAAAARRFCSCIDREIGSAESPFKVSLKYHIEREGFSVKRILPEFMGLFDTVSSYGLLPSIFTNNVNALALKVERPLKTVHFVAADERRAYFALTRINSARHGSMELIMPGVHSDIGGGYNNYLRQYYKYCGRSEDELISGGWIRDVGDEYRVVRNEYSLLVLSYMVKIINRFRGDTVSTITPDIRSLPTEVQAFKNILYNIRHKPLYKFDLTPDKKYRIKEVEKNISSVKSELFALRYGFLHFSSSNRIGMHAAKGGERIIIDDV